MMSQAELNHWARSCLGKRKYAFQHHAEKAASVRGRRAGLTLNTYYCGYCCGYHLTRSKVLPA